MAPSFASRERRSPEGGVRRATVESSRPQSKLRVGSASDPAERDADRMADAVMAQLTRPAVADHESAWPTETRIRRSSRGPNVGAEGGPVDAGLEREIQRARGGGSPLAADVRGAMETGFGSSFGEVRIHTGSSADALNRSLHARAFTIGRDVFFAGGEYQPRSQTGQRLLAHELAHTVQQGAAGMTAARTIRRFARDDVGRPTPNLGHTRQVKAVGTGQCVFVLEDDDGDVILVKGDNVPVGVNQLFATVLHQVTNTKSIKMSPLPSGDRAAMKTLLADPGKTHNDSWADMYNAQKAHFDRYILGRAKPANLARFGGAVPAGDSERGRLVQMEQLDGQSKLVAMTKAEGRSIRDVMADQGDATVGARTAARDLFGDPKHMEKLGMVTAADLFLGNLDRVLSSNFGNWFVDPAGAITLIDNVDKAAKDGMKHGTLDENEDGGLYELSKGQIAATAHTCVDNLIAGMRAQGDVGVDNWAAAVYLQKKGKTRQQIMEAAFLKGLRSGKARIVKLYATQKWRGAGRMTKRVANSKQAEDTGRGDQPDDGKDYWETMKARARWLKAN